ncbi:MAG: polysaccharide biosynthesis C-terminal domain-containing protein [Oceanospirillaceae bacterium]|nr:polysaccharide biosynthesis C-terminal domain-containing protein [Oceanospirillaceae bacterium]
MRHVFTLTLTSSVGLVSLFAVDLIDLYFLTLLENQAIIAALGFAASIMFFNMSFSIGLSIAMSATVARAIGAKQDLQARGLALNNFVFSVSFTTLVAAVTWLFKTPLLELIGASGNALIYADQYLSIILPSLPFLAVAMSGSALLRAMGSPKLSMLAMLSGSAVNVILDPIFIFGLDLGIEGAAIASVFSRFSVGAMALYFIYARHDFYCAFNFNVFKQHLQKIFTIAIPAMATQLATPFANAYMTYEIAKFGESYMAGWSITGRITPVAFGVIFALSAAVGPIYAQNFGAGDFARVRKTLYDSCLFVTSYCVVAAMIFYLSIDALIIWFGATDEGAEFMRFVAIWIGPAFSFYGFLFVANAAFNNLGYPLISTAFNFAKATVGTVPFVMIGVSFMGADGVFMGNTAGNLVFGIAALSCCFYIINKLTHRPLGTQNYV